MSSVAVQFVFDPDVSLAEAEMSLHLAMFAVEGLIGRARVRLDAKYHIDEANHAIVVDTRSAAGRVIVRVSPRCLMRKSANRRSPWNDSANIPFLKPWRPSMLFSSFWRHRNGTPRRLLDSLCFLDCEPLDAYLAQETEHLTADQLNEFRKDPFIFHKRQTGLLPGEKAHDQDMDRAAVVRTLESRHEFDRQFASGGPVDPKTGKPYDEYSREFREWAGFQHRIVLTPEQAQRIEHIEYGVRMHPEARRLLADGVAQGVVRCDYRGVSCQSRLDWISPTQGLVGMVVCDGLTWLDVTLRSNGVVHHLAFEQALISRIAEADLPVHVIAVEKRAPHRCGVWLVSKRLVRKARKENEAAIDRFKRCRNNDHWPTGYEKLRVLAPVGF